MLKQSERQISASHSSWDILKSFCGFSPRDEQTETEYTFASFCGWSQEENHWALKTLYYVFGFAWLHTFLPNVINTFIELPCFMLGDLLYQKYAQKSFKEAPLKTLFYGTLGILMSVIGSLAGFVNYSIRLTLRAMLAPWSSIDQTVKEWSQAAGDEYSVRSQVAGVLGGVTSFLLTIVGWGILSAFILPLIVPAASLSSLATNLNLTAITSNTAAAASAVLGSIFAAMTTMLGYTIAPLFSSTYHEVKLDQEPTLPEPTIDSVEKHGYNNVSSQLDSLKTPSTESEEKKNKSKTLAQKPAKLKIVLAKNKEPISTPQNNMS